MILTLVLYYFSLLFLGLLQMGPGESPVSFLRINYSNLDINSAERGFDCPK